MKYWSKAEEVLKKQLEKIIYRTDEDGDPLPFTFDLPEAAFDWIIKNCTIPIKDSVKPSFAVRLYQPFSKGEPESPLLNSFFFEDLQRARTSLDEGAISTALSQYLGITKPAAAYDVLKDKQHIESALQPKNTPPCRWPGRGRYPLVLLQQTAVNLAVQELENVGVFSVNGPPGTGKTTLLRDIVAAVVLKRAKAMCAFDDPEAAFTHSGKIKLGNSFVHLYSLDDTLRGQEIVVASTNNKAVENVSKELPLRKQIADDLYSFSYFKTLSDALSDNDDETWGAIAAVLGNAANRSKYVHNAWWDENTGLFHYFRSIMGQLDLEPDENGMLQVPEIVLECDPPTDLAQANTRWGIARKRFLEALEKSELAIEKAQRAYQTLQEILQIKRNIHENVRQQNEQRSLVAKLSAFMDGLRSRKEYKDSHINAIQARVAESLERKPGILKRLFARSEWKEWKLEYGELRENLRREKKIYHEINSEEEEAQKELQNANTVISNLISEKHKLEQDVAVKQQHIDSASPIFGDKLITPELWEKSYEEQQLFHPNFTDEAQGLRDDVFVAAIALHKAFIDASTKKIRQNLAGAFAMLHKGGLPPDKRELIPHLWSTLFILTPVISTAFASVGRMFKEMTQESIGWLLIDEAGQATPQAAVGAIYRSKRVISVGDPLQIEPVVTLPLSLGEGISKYLGVDPDIWTAPFASVQSLSDNANIYGAIIPRDLSEIRIGLPLLVHRRCENPMFTISNQLAYSNLMVYATKSDNSPVTDVFGSQVKWFDINGNSQEKWCPEEGEHVTELLLQACEVCDGDPGIFVITPFRIVAERMRRRMRQESGRLKSLGIADPDTWIGDNIGTVHTFQGKETRAVIFLLGAPDPAQNGARNWATSNVNLLNVAVSRAQQNFYIVGNKSLWSNLGSMKVLSKYVH